MGIDVDAPLARLAAGELLRPPPPAAEKVGAAIRERHGASVAAILFYGSCLRKQTDEGVLDFYVLVDGYRAAYRRWFLSLINALVPPNVFYIEHTEGGETLRAKYAVLSTLDFARGVSPGCRHPYFWARFSQPTMIVFVRDEEARNAVIRGVAQAIQTLVRRLVVFLPARNGVQRFSLAALWQNAFSRTYTSELRTESADTVRGVYEASPERYDEAAHLALVSLGDDGWLEELEFRGRSAEVRISPWRRTLGRWRWHCERPIAKLLALARLVKNSLTFGDWLPYVLWKIQRHTGVEVEVTERQRRHPLIFAWPILFRLLRDRSLR